MKVNVVKCLHMFSELSQEEGLERRGMIQRGDPALLGERQKAGPAERADKGPGGRPLVRELGRDFVCW